jgi:hypothetical protein
VAIGQQPERIIDKGIPGPDLLCSILVDKYMNHLALYRQRQRFARQGIATSSLEGWVLQGLERLRREHGRVPERIQVDNGSEFISKALDRWAYNNVFGRRSTYFLLVTGGLAL